jgi:hypothetical protein
VSLSATDVLVELISKIADVMMKWVPDELSRVGDTAMPGHAAADA